MISAKLAFYFFASIPSIPVHLGTLEAPFTPLKTNLLGSVANSEGVDAVKLE